MGLPRELTEEERAKLIADGYKPVEMWVLDLDNPEVLERIRKECEAIRESDRRNGELDYLDEVTAALWDDFK
jgi:hypothetical protein